MKKTFRLMVALFATMTLAGLTGCEKEPAPDVPDTPRSETVNLTGTSWVGVFNDTYQNYAAVLRWSLDFVSETEGELFFELTVAGQQQGSYNVPFEWTFDGVSGVMNAGEMGATEFKYDSVTNTITMNLMVEVEQDGAAMGGMTTFYPRGSEPDEPDVPDMGDSTRVTPGEITDQFPANTRWHASQETVYPTVELGDLPMTLVYELTFRNNHTGFITVTATVLGQASEPQRVWYNWEFDNTTNMGNFIVQEAPLPFTYNPVDNTITSDFSFDVQGSGQQVGGTLTFTQVTKSGKYKIRLG